MLSLDSDPLDYLPYIDGTITDTERQAVEQLIRAETPAEPGMLHSRLGELAPLSENRSLLMRDMERFELDYSDGLVPETFVSGGVSMDRYTDFGPDHDFSYDQMYTALLYSVLRDRNAQLAAEHSAERAHAQKEACESMRQVESLQRDLLVRKRERTEELNLAREAKQMQFQPVDGYLEQRWKDGIKGIVDTGIERHAGP
ncbi:hypothetical protein METBIDRAFT_30224 [Metschnikowia bicuspidata var. bicuspidata NRRL YB-4993]|uniref:Uncharacterized protein n=1 Tax=Metschnikowia bicuspidata var. bicuspidata NRRL YB-4993 TaxID=869754 RepID=A0A1A0HIJ3_9ASCO|nr:hypothetical protein METBIDRAFT_30224 [Metschnikowia bicuspidata var. bicuspidata NRRL YB-4993]OBA23835.1 hypothetical protein METBIDRAFT_30224 [Metschnikowia bicuspidata var. bicuspidata NRRL YB-4993]